MSEQIVACTHKLLGAVKITECCKELQALNPDATSMFVEHNGEIKEVSKSLVSIYGDNK